MERWLSKARVLIGLSAVLLIAALNRQDPMLYCMFLFLATLSALGYALPWLSLRSLRVKLEAGRYLEVNEGAPLAIGILIENVSRWPSFMVEVRTEWTGSGHTLVASETLGVIRRGRVPDLAHGMQLDCRGEYVLTAVRLGSGFPLGLTRATLTLERPDARVLVLPRPLATQWPLPWDTAEDHRGELTTRRLGQSLEPGILRPYEHGEPVGRVSWGASARAGELIIQHYQQQGARRLRVVVDRPPKADAGDADSAGEQAIRHAAGLVLACVQQGVQTFTHAPDQAEPVRNAAPLLPALARVRTGESALAAQLARVAGEVKAGEQVAVVVSAATRPELLLAALAPPRLRTVRVAVCIVTRRRAAPPEWVQARALQDALADAGWPAWTEAS